MNKTRTINVDFAILGGGIAGLWTLSCLRRLGYHAVLLESNLLGGGQTINSQGIIHGGIKYSLTGLLSNSYKEISSLPSRWQEHIKGNLHPNLSDVEIFTKEQYLWSTGTITGNFYNFLASKSLKSKVIKISECNYPEIIKVNNFKGNVYKVYEDILNVPSLIHSIVNPYKQYCLQANVTVNHLDPQTVDNLCYCYANHSITIKAQHYIFTAGNGNQELTAKFSPKPITQYRPLHMVVAHGDYLPKFYGHNIDGNLNPIITISTHHIGREEKNLWYMGGQLAESGVNLSAEEQISKAHDLLFSLFKEDFLQDLEWRSYKINRAEAYQHNSQRPDKPIFKQYNNATIAWPTKLTFTPILVDNILASSIIKKINKNPKLAAIIPDELPKAQVGTAFWQTAY